jgi:hypothetical protein
MRTATLINVDRPEYGVVTVDLDLLRDQINWLSTMPVCDEMEGLLNLFGGIADLADYGEKED